MSDLDKSIGGQNKYFMWCSEVEQKRAYGSCLCLVSAYQAGRLNANDPIQNCAGSMSRGNCIAVKMREEEIAAGKALYFIEGLPRPERMGSSSDMTRDEGYQRGWNQVGKSMGEAQPARRRGNTSERIDVAKTDELATAGDMDMGALITRELKREKNELLVTAKIKEIKREIVAVAKLNPRRARELMTEAKRLQQSIS